MATNKRGESLRLPDLDAQDAKALELLQQQGRITWADLGQVLGLSPPAAAERVRRLEANGVIRGYTALTDGRTLGFELTAFVGVSLEKPKYRAAFLELVQQLPEIQECHHVTGDHDYLLKVRCRNTLDLERIINEHLKGTAGVSQTRTTIVLSTSKESVALPLPGA